jgi:hypothetical protein
VRAVKALGQLAGIHPGLAIAAAQQVLEPGDAYEPYVWADVERAPLEVSLAAGDLPKGIYRPHTAYPVSAFALSASASNDLASIEQMLGRPVEHVQFDGSDVAQARALGAAHGENWHTVIVGTDVAAQLVGDYLARSVKELRKRAREERKLARSSQAPANGSSGSGAADGSTGFAGTGNGATVESEEARRAEREAERQAREDATRFNLELGRAVYTSLSRVRIDESVLKCLRSSASWPMSRCAARAMDFPAGSPKPRRRTARRNTATSRNRRPSNAPATTSWVRPSRARSPAANSPCSRWPPTPTRTPSQPQAVAGTTSRPAAPGPSTPTSYSTTSLPTTSQAARGAARAGARDS